MTHHSLLYRWRVPAYVVGSLIVSTIVQLIVKGGF